MAGWIGTLGARLVVLDRPDVLHAAVRPPAARRDVVDLELIEVPPVDERRAGAWQPLLHRREELRAV
eukprot:8021010-Heterocapsa_arctica.AAC.1